MSKKNVDLFHPSQRSLERASLRAILIGKFWGFIQCTIFRWSWRFNGARIFLLRCFGAKFPQGGVSIHPGARISGPGRLTVGETSSIGNHSWVDARGGVTIGQKCCVGEWARLLTGTHDITTSNFQYITKAITIGDAVWIATGAIVLPGVTIGDGAVVAAGALVTKNVEPWTVVGGNPAKVIKKRELRTGE